MDPSFVTAAFVAAFVLSTAVKMWLATRQMRHVALNRPAVPTAFAGTVTLAAHQRAADYTLAKGRFGLWTMAFGGAVLLGWTLLGGLEALNTVVSTTTPHSSRTTCPPWCASAASTVERWWDRSFGAGRTGR